MNKSNSELVVYSPDSVLLAYCNPTYMKPIEYIQHNNYGVRKLKIRLAAKKKVKSRAIS